MKIVEQKPKKKIPKVKAKLKRAAGLVVDLEPTRARAKKTKEAKVKAEKDQVRPALPRGEGSYVRQEVRCGDSKCHCMTGGKLHGPYWYLFTKKDGKERSKYIGKNLPATSEL